MKRLLILGATGSIGVQALDVVSGGSEHEVVGLAAQRNWERLLEQAQALGVGRVALTELDAAARAAECWTDGDVLGGPEGLTKLIVESEADLVLNALVGSAGLGPTVTALGEGIDVALANKESLVVGGELVMKLAEATGARVIPVDSEHSALFQLLRQEAPGAVERLVLTASGGPFRGRDAQSLRNVTAAEALALAAVGSLSFEPPDVETFRCLGLAREAAAAGGTGPCILNAANEVAVHAFLSGRLAF